ncbi:MAG: TetR/AcrR family transcriptional regulator [Candidatus Hydrogenedentes bacterium]|nr:TetR/AcrR family transcriptional regulator [Candidatus Hydrogenedentota bacterium]
MAFSSPRLRKLKERDDTILDTAREIFLEDGYYGLTMNRIAARCGLSKGTMYHYFSCKEEIIIALAERAFRKRTELMHRGTLLKGKTRERILAVGEAVVLFVLLNMGDSRIIHAAMGTLREKTPPLRLQALVQAEQEQLGILRGVIDEALLQGDLTLTNGTTVDEILLGTWGLVDGAHLLIESGAHGSSLQLSDPFERVWRFWNFAADGYGWKPFFAEWDYGASLLRARAEVFAEEARAIYGEAPGLGNVSEVWMQAARRPHADSKPS